MAIKTVLEIEIYREDFDKLFPNNMTVLYNLPRYEELLYTNLRYSNVEDCLSYKIRDLVKSNSKYSYSDRVELEEDLDELFDIIERRGKTPHVMIRERF